MKNILLTALLTCLAPQFPAQAALTDHDVNFVGYVTYASSWIKDEGNFPLCGFYAFSRDTQDFTQLTNDEWDVIASNGGVIAQGNAYAFYTSSSWMKPNPKLFIYDAETWQLKHTRSYGETETYAMADMTYDYSTKEILAVAYASKRKAGNGILYRINSENGDLTQLASLAQLFIGIAADTDGTLWTLSESGILYRLNRNGRAFSVGHTGLTPQAEEEANSLVIDHRTGRLYWAASVYYEAHSGEMYRGIYEIDKNTGKATLCHIFDNNERITALSIPAPQELEAPDDIFDLNVIPVQPGDHAGHITFTVPSVSYKQSALEAGKLKAHAWVDGTPLPDSEVEAGSTASIAYEVANEGKHTFMVQLEDSKGRLGQKFHMERYIGYDIPSVARNIQLTFDRERQKIALTWEPVTQGIHGGDVDAKNLRYLITRYAPGEKEDVASDLTEASYTETITRGMAYTRYGITVYDGTHESSITYSPYANVGQAQSLPFSCGINSWGDFHRFITIDANNDGYEDWGTPSWYYDEAYGAAFCYLTSGDSHDDWLVTPALALQPGHSYQVIFQTYGYYGYPNHLQVAAGKYPEADQLNHLLDDFVYSVPMPEKFPYEANEVKTCSVIFTATANDRYIGFHNISEHLNKYYYTDHMSIDNIYIRDLEGSGIHGVTYDKEVEGPCFDLSGRVITNGTSRGLYIQNGKKLLHR